MKRLSLLAFFALTTMLFVCAPLPAQSFEGDWAGKWDDNGKPLLLIIARARSDEMKGSFDGSPFIGGAAAANRFWFYLKPANSDKLIKYAGYLVTNDKMKGTEFQGSRVFTAVRKR